MRWRLAAVLLLTAACLAWVVAGLDLSATGRLLVAYRWERYAMAFGVLAAVTALRVGRFALLLDRRVPWRALLSIHCVGFLAMTVVPLRLGEFVRPALLDERGHAPFGSGLAAVVLERLCDVLGLLGVIAFTGAVVALPAGQLQLAGVDLLAWGLRSAGLAAVAVVVSIVVAGVAGRPLVDGAVARLGRRAPGLAAAIESLGGRFVDGLEQMAAHPARAAAALGLTAVIWAAGIGGVAFALSGLPGLEVTFDAALLTWTSCMVAVAATPTPGYVGTFEAAGQAALTAVGVGAELATAGALAVHALIIGFNVSTGLFFLVAEGVSLSSVVQRSQQLGRDDAP